MKKGDILYVNLTQRNGKNITKGRRLCIVISNNKHNSTSETLTVLPMSSKTYKKNNKYNIFLAFDEEALSEVLYKDNIVLISQVRTIDTCNVIRKIASVDTESKWFKFLIRKVVNYLND